MTTCALTSHALFRTPEGGLLFGAEHASLFAVDAQTCDLIEALAARGAFDPDAEPEERKAPLDELLRTGVLRSVRPAAAEADLPFDPEEAPLETLILETAQACNLRCAYCYADGGSYGGKPGMLDPEAARRAARHLVERSGDRKSLTLVLFGGEPLLNFPAVKAAVEEAERLARETGKTLTLSLTTNGTCFTDEALDFLRAHRVILAVSIDGPPGLHDANRRYASGGGTYRDVVAGIDALHRRGIPAGARVTLTPDQWDRVPEVFDHLLELGFREAGIAPASPIHAGLLPTPEQEEALFAGFSSLARRFVEEAKGGRVLPFGNLLDLLARLHKGRVKGMPCGAGYGYFAVDTKEKLFLCHRLSGEKAFEVGTVADGPDYDRLREVLREAALSRRELCAGCWARPLCAGGCHYENHIREQRLGQAPGGSCRFIRRWLELGIRVYAELCGMPDNPVLQRLSGRIDC